MSEAEAIEAIETAALQKRSRIEVRRFAGHLDHAERLSRPLRLVHFTDIHVGRVTPMQVQYDAVELVNREKPDLVAITGDFVAHSHLYLDALEDVISKVQAPVFCVLGNHDHWSGADEVRNKLLRAGAEVLDNVNTAITIRGERVQFVGVDDEYTGHADVEKALKGLDHKHPVIGLSHIAEVADEMWNDDVNLVLSGHTHAGQITLARLHEIALGTLGGHRYVHGLYGCRASQRASGAVYVGAGIGASVMPVRIGDRGKREITVFELGAEPGSLEEHHEEQPALPGREVSEKKREKRKNQVQKKAARRRKRSAKVQKKRTEGKTNGDEDSS